MKTLTGVFNFIIVTFLVVSCQKTTDESRPYEFGFTIDQQQHRHEKKDESGIIQGEFGFITADGIYHVTVYATDENGNFRILSMKNLRISAPLDGSPLPPGAKISGQPGATGQNLPGAAAPPVAPPQPSQVAQLPPQPSQVAQLSPQQQPGVSTGINRPSGEQPYQFTTQRTIATGCAQCNVTQKKPASEPFVFQNPAFSNGNNQPNNPGIPESPSHPQGPFGANLQLSPLGPNNPGFPGSQSNLQGPLAGNPQFPSPILGNNPRPPTTLLGGNNPTSLSNSPVGENPQTGPGFIESPQNSGNFAPPTSQGGFAGFTGNNPRPPTTLLGPNNPSSGQFPGSTGNGNGLPSGEAERPQSPLGNAVVSGGMIHVPGNPAIPIKDKFPNMVNGLPNGVEEKDITDLLYKFHYEVGFHGHYEKGTRNGGKIGGYFVNGRDGISRIVTYVADENGYRPKVKFVRLGLDETPNEATEKTFGLKSFEFIWYPIK